MEDKHVELGVLLDVAGERTQMVSVTFPNFPKEKHPGFIGQKQIQKVFDGDPGCGSKLSGRGYQVGHFNIWFKKIKKDENDQEEPEYPLVFWSIGGSKSAFESLLEEMIKEKYPRCHLIFEYIGPQAKQTEDLHRRGFKVKNSFIDGEGTIEAEAKAKAKSDPFPKKAEEMRE